MGDKVALITGVSRPLGLGFAVARQLAERGYHVIISGRELDTVGLLASTLRDERLTVEAIRLDVTDWSEFEAIASAVRARLGHLDVLVNNASTMPDFAVGSALDADLGDVRLALEVDVLGPWALVQAFRALLEAAPAGRVVNITSGVSLQINRECREIGAPAHALGKYVLEVTTQILAGAFADSRVLVNAVDPGRVDTHPEFGYDPDDVTPEVAARAVVAAAILPADGPNGDLFRNGSWARQAFGRAERDSAN